MNQFGFLPGRNVFQAIKKLLNYIYSGLDCGLSWGAPVIGLTVV